ncbi:MAG: 2-oxo acid dehydrogenase subunit E2 [Myxococcales bacterium]|nr:2-oxo acid dehydrogenase subunit E2 [Myxococcales bacterium]
MDRSRQRRVRFPTERRLVLDTLHLGHEKPMMHGLLEVDVTLARQRIAAHREQTGVSLSFTAFVLHCLGQAAAAHPAVHARRDWFGRLVEFDDVDATVIVETEVEGRKFALAHVVRDLQRRTVQDVHDELRSVQRGGMHTLSPALRLGSWLVLHTPAAVRRLGYRAVLGSPTFAKRHTGTMLVSAVGMFGGGVGWGLSAPGIHDLSILVGGIAPRPPLSPDASPREVLCLTVSANHEIVDGAPLARFVRDLTGALQGADGLR